MALKQRWQPHKVPEVLYMRVIVDVGIYRYIIVTEPPQYERRNKLATYGERVQSSKGDGNP